MRLISQLPSGATFAAGWAKVREIVDHLMASRLIAGNGIRLTEHPNGIVIDVIAHRSAGVGGAGGSTFTGPLQIIASGSASIKIVNTSTYNATTGASAGSICRINNVEYLLADFSHTPSATTYYYVRFVPPLTYVSNGTTTTQTASASIVTSTTVKTSADPNDNYANYYRIGYVVKSESALTIVNEITAQPNFGWFVNIYPD